MQFFQKLFTRHQKNSNRLVQLKKEKKMNFVLKRVPVLLFATVCSPVIF